MTCISSVYLLLTWNIVGARKTPLWSVAFQTPGREPSFCLFSRFAGLLATFSDICLAKKTSCNMKDLWYSAFKNILFGQWVSWRCTIRILFIFPIPINKTMTKESRLTKTKTFRFFGGSKRAILNSLKKKKRNKGTKER